MGMSRAFGTLGTMIISGTVSKGLDKTDPVACFDTIQKVVFIQNCVVGAAVILLLILFREKPEYPPSQIATVHRVITKGGISDDIAVLRKNWNYLGTAWTFTVI